MLFQNNACYLYQTLTRQLGGIVVWKRIGLLFRKQFKPIFLLLIFFIVFLPVQIFSQPLASGKSKFLGCSISTIRSDFSKYWNQVTPENAGKWGSVETSPGVYDWTGLDNIYNYALSNGFLYKHHNLIWGSQQPFFMTNNSLDSAGQRAEIEQWIRLVGQRYPQMSMIDVVNEPFTTAVPYKNALGGNGATGWDWVVTAFTWARQYCAPGVKLLINEYNILQNNGITNNYIALIDTLKVRGLIDGIGIQGHYFEFKSPAGASNPYSYPLSTLKSNLDKIAAATGLPIYISEFDINEADDTIQLQNYQIYFPLFWEDAGVKGITLWGYYQYNTWKPNAYLVRTDGSPRPALQWLHTYLIYAPVPVNLSPNGTAGVPRNPRLSWNSSASAVTYGVQVSLDSLFTSVVVDTTVSDTLLQLRPLAANTKFYWHVNAENDSGESSYSVTANFTTGDQIVAVKELEAIPMEFKLFQNYPNPFNPSTVITYQLPTANSVKLKVYDILGREVALLVNENQRAGYYNVTFNAKNLPSGVYFYRIDAGNYFAVKKLVLMR